MEKEKKKKKVDRERCYTKNGRLIPTAKGGKENKTAGKLIYLPQDLPGRGSPQGRSRPLLLRISSAHAIHWSRACHVIFKRAHRFENSTKHRADDLCVNLVCEYFCWMLGGPHVYFGRSLPFLTLYHAKKQKKSVWEVLIISHILLKKGRIGTWIQVCVT